MLSILIKALDWLEKLLEGFIPNGSDNGTSGMLSATSLVIFVLITTCIYSVRMTTLYNMYTARMNVCTYAKLAESERYMKKKKYLQVAWPKASIMRRYSIFYRKENMRH